MAGGNTASDTLRMGRDERGYFITARGAIRAQLCSSLRELLLEKLDEGARVPAVYADLSACRYMDSTFIGLLVAADKRLHKSSGGRLHVLSPSPEARDTLAQIGLLGYFLIEESMLPEPADMQDMHSRDAPGPRAPPSGARGADGNLRGCTEEVRALEGSAGREAQGPETLAR